MVQGRIVGLRPVEERDLDFLAELSNDLHVRGMVGGWDFPVPRHGQIDWLTRSHQNPSVVRLAVVLPDADAVVGLTGLWDIDSHNRSALTAVKLKPGMAPKGAGSDAIMLMNALAFYDFGLHRLHGSILDFNGPSMGAYVGGCGWRVEGCERQSVFRKGTWHDLYRVAILRGDFDALESAQEYVEYVCPTDVSQKLRLPTNG